MKKGSEGTRENKREVGGRQGLQLLTAPRRQTCVQQGALPFRALVGSLETEHFVSHSVVSWASRKPARTRGFLFVSSRDLVVDTAGPLYLSDLVSFCRTIFF